MLDPSQFRTEIIRPTLAVMGDRFGGRAAENLLLGTALAEGRLEYVRQRGGGPALGVYQCEPPTFVDVLARGGDALPRKVYIATLGRPASDMVWDLRLATLVCRLKYFLAPQALPPADDAAALSAYHKLIYNTPLGAADPVANRVWFQKAIDTP
jgi:hypothetical protein